MAKLTHFDEAATAFTEAHTLLEKVVSGEIYAEAKTAATLERAKQQYAVALEYFEGHSHLRQAGEVYDDLGYLALHCEDDPNAALPLFLKAAEIFAEIGDVRDQLATLLELNMIDPFHPETERAIAEAITRGLPFDLTPEEDPVIWAVAKREADDLEAAHSLIEALLQEALARNDKARAAKLLGERSIVEERNKNRQAAAASFEASLELAQEAGSKEETLRAMLHLVDTYWSNGNKSKARELFERAEKIRGVPESLRSLRRIMALNFK